MITRRAWRWLAALVLPVTLLVPMMAGQAGVAGATGATITGGGSSYAAPAIDAWTADVSSLGLNVNYSTSSSVIGLNEFCQNQINFGASEIGYSTDQAQCSPAAGNPADPYQYMPDIAGATCLMYNLNSVTDQQITQLALTPQVLLGIFTGTITTWNNSAIQSINSGIALPSTPIHVVYRTDASGDNYIFSDYFATLYPSEWAGFTSAMGTPSGAQALWPTPPGGTSAGQYSEANWVGQNGSDGASNYVASTAGTITYVETAYAISHQLPCAYIQNASGQYVQPSEPGDSLALTHDQLAPDLEQNLTAVFSAPEPTAYPISAYSYIISQEGQMSPSVGAVLGAFMKYAACQGQESAGTLGYAPLPDVLVADDMAAITRMPGSPAVPNPITAQNCPDPYITGAYSVGNSVGGDANQAGAEQVAPAGAGSGGATTTTTAPGSGGATAAASSGHGSGSGAKLASGSSAVLDPKKVSDTKVAGGSSAPTGQIPGVALAGDAGKLLHLPGPAGAIIFWCIVLLALVAGPPVVAALYRRRRPRGQPPEEAS